VVNLKPADIIFWSGTSPISRLIRWVTKSRWSHVAWVVDGKYLIEADWMGVVMAPVSEYLKYPKQVAVKRIIDLPAADAMDCMNSAMTQLKRGYDFLLLVEILIKLVFYKRWKIRSRKRKFICSELVAEVYECVIGKRLVPKTDDEVTPEDLFRSPHLVEIPH
jgi:hypothetical protein